MQRLSEGGIDVVLLDLGMPELSGSKTFTAVQVMAPNTPILAFTADAQIDTRRSTLASGAADYLIKDQLSPGDLSEAIRAAIGRYRNRGKAIPEPAPGSGPGRAVAFIGAKGGVGVTTTLLNMAAAMAREKPTIAMEAPTPGGFSLVVPSLKPFIDRKAKPTAPDKEWMKRNVEPSTIGAGLLFDPLSAWRVAPWKETGAAVQYAHRIVQLARNMTSYVLIDAGSQMDDVAASFVAECQTVIVVTDCEPSSTAAASKAIAWVEVNKRPECEIGVLAVNRCGVASPDAEQMRAHFGRPIFGVIPNAGPPAAWNTGSAGRLAVLEPDSELTSSLLQSAWNLMERMTSRATR